MRRDAKTQVATAPHSDQILLASALSLVALGLTMIFIASNVMAQAEYHDPYYFFTRQGVYALLGLGVLFLARTINYQHYQRCVYHFLFLCCLGLLLVFVPGIGGKVRGAARWLRLGPLTVQPSEFAKLALVLFPSGT